MEESCSDDLDLDRREDFPPPEVVSVALWEHHLTGLLPSDPRLAEIVEGIAEFLEATEGTVPGA